MPVRLALPIALLTTAALPVVVPNAAHARAGIGDAAPWFRLQTIAGRTVSRDKLRGRVVALVVGQTYESAPPCKRWVIELSKKTSATVYQVIVTDTPWYIPRGIVMRKIKSFTPAQYYDRVLVEWYRVFAKSYQVRKNDHPTVFVIDGRGVIRLRLEGAPDAKRYARVSAAIARLK